MYSAAPSFTWNGPYVGAVIGGGFGSGIHCDNATCTGGAPTYPSPDFSGFLGGVTVGYNFQPSGPWVFGVEGDVALASIDGSANTTATYGCAGTGGCRTFIDGMGTIRARAGYAMGHFLPYATAGVAFTKIGGSIGNPVLASDSSIKSSFTVGGGLEFAINSQWSAKAEYLYVADPGTYNFAPAFCVAPGCQIRDNDYHILRVGLNYHF